MQKCHQGHKDDMSTHLEEGLALINRMFEEGSLFPGLALPLGRMGKQLVLSDMKA